MVVSFDGGGGGGEVDRDRSRQSDRERLRHKDTETNTDRDCSFLIRCEDQYYSSPDVLSGRQVYITFQFDNAIYC